MLTVKEIVDLATELGKQFQGQKALDELCLGIVMQKHIVEMAADPNFPSKPVGMGRGALITKQNYAFLATPPFTSFNAPKESQKAHAELLEQANGAVWKASGARKAWLRATSDVASVGRGWLTIYASPKRWSGEEFKKKDDETDKEYLERLRELKLEKFPIVASYVDFHDCWPTFDEMGEVDQVVKKSRMKVRQIKREYGVTLADKRDEEEVEVIRYADSEEARTIIGGKDAVEAREPFEHGLGMNPFVLLEAPVLPDNDDGWRWAGSVFDLRHLIPELDGAFSDLRHQTKRQTHSQPVLNLDLEGRRLQSPTAKSNADLIEDSPDKPLILDLKESHSDRFPHGLTSPEVMAFLDRGDMVVKENAIRPVLLGILEGDASGVKYNTGAAIAQGSFGPAIENLGLAADGVTRRNLASIKALSKDFADITDADKVPVIYADGKGGSKVIEIGPDDVRGWGGAGTIESRIDLNIPINENAEIMTARAYADSKDGLGSTETALRRWCHVEDPIREMRTRRKEALTLALDASLVRCIEARGMQIQAQPTTQPGVLAQRMAALPPEIQGVIQQYGASRGQQIPGLPEARGAGATMRATQPQNPSQTVATQIRGQPSG